MATGARISLSRRNPGLITTPWDGQPSDTHRSTLHLLTVGISQYHDSGFDVLPYASRSAKAVETALRQQSENPERPYAGVRVWDGLYDSSATRANWNQRLSQMAKEVKADDVVLLYMAGHGRVLVGQEMFYFVPVDGQEQDLPGTGISTAMLAEALRNLPARRILLLIDACQAGGAIEALSKIGAVKAEAEQRKLQRQGFTTGSTNGVGVHPIAATLPLSYAVGAGLQNGDSALADTFIDALKQDPDLSL